MKTLKDCCDIIVDNSDDGKLQIPMAFIEQFDVYFEIDNNTGEYIVKTMSVQMGNEIKQVPKVLLFNDYAHLVIEFEANKEVRQVLMVALQGETDEQVKRHFKRILPDIIIELAEQTPQMQGTGEKKSIEQVEKEIDELLKENLHEHR